MNLHNLLFERDPMKRMQMFENQMQQRKGIKLNPKKDIEGFVWLLADDGTEACLMGASGQLSQLARSVTPGSCEDYFHAYNWECQSAFGGIFLWSSYYAKAGTGLAGGGDVSICGKYLYDSGFKKVEMEKDHLNSFINAFLKYPGKSIGSAMHGYQEFYEHTPLFLEKDMVRSYNYDDDFSEGYPRQYKYTPMQTCRAYLNMLLIWGGQIASIILCIAEASNEDCPKRIDFLDLWAGTDRFEGYVKRVVELYRRALEFVEAGGMDGDPLPLILTAYLFDIVAATCKCHVTAKTVWEKYAPSTDEIEGKKKTFLSHPLVIALDIVDLSIHKKDKGKENDDVKKKEGDNNQSMNRSSEHQPTTGVAAQFASEMQKLPKNGEQPTPEEMAKYPESLRKAIMRNGRYSRMTHAMVNHYMKMFPGQDVSSMFGTTMSTGSEAEDGTPPSAGTSKKKKKKKKKKEGDGSSTTSSGFKKGFLL